MDVPVLLASTRSGAPPLRSFQQSTQGYQRSLCPPRNTQRAAAAPRSNTQQSSQRRQLAMASSLINAPRGGETGSTINRILSTSRYLNTGGRQSFLGTSTATSFSLGKLEHAKLPQSALVPGCLWLAPPWVCSWPRRVPMRPRRCSPGHLAKLVPVYTRPVVPGPGRPGTGDQGQGQGQEAAVDASVM